MPGTDYRFAFTFLPFALFSSLRGFASASIAWFRSDRFEHVCDLLAKCVCSRVWGVSGLEPGGFSTHDPDCEIGRAVAVRVEIDLNDVWAARFCVAEVINHRTINYARVEPDAGG